MKKSVKKHSALKRKKTNSVLLIRYLSITFVILLLILTGNFVSRATNKIHILGASTGQVNLLADSGDSIDNNSNSQPLPSQTPSPTNDNNDNKDAQTIPQQAGIHNTQLPNPNGTQQQQQQQQLPDNTQVACIGPDGKQFTTDFHNCQELNQKWGNDNFNFTPLGNVSGNQDQPSQSSDSQQNNTQPEPTNAPSNQGKLEVQTEGGNKVEVNLQASGSQIQIKKEDNGATSITVHKADGTETQIQNNANNLDQITQSLGNPNLQIIPNSTNGFAIKSGDVQAETNLPISIDPTTKSLAVTTPNGTKDVTVLPSQAVQNVLGKNILSNVLSSANQTTPNATSANKTIALTNVDNQPAFAIQGISNSKLLGIFPVAFPKTVYVSAQNGQVLQTQESFINQLLQAISF